MMINKRLINTVGESKKYIAGNVALQWCSLVANITMITSITTLLASLYQNQASTNQFFSTAIVTIAAIMTRLICTMGAARMGYFSAKAVKKTMREMIYQKMLNLGAAYKERVSTAEVVQVSVEGVDQLESYFASYLPQFFYAMLAPITLFIVLCSVNFLSALVLLICVPLIPLAIAAVQTFAKKLLAKYWGQYTALGDTFLENLQGLTTLKIYQTDDYKNEEMNQEAEKFRKITMKVLSMQLNSITIMDLIAYGGAALGMIMAVTQYRSGHVTLAGCMLIILLAADYFIPMRQLGSYFHIAMNGMAASDKIFKLLDEEVDQNDRQTGQEVLNPHFVIAQQEVASTMEGLTVESQPSVTQDDGISCQNLTYSYDQNREILHQMTLMFPVGKFTAIVGESGSGKSTIAGILMGRNKGYDGQVTINGLPLGQFTEPELMQQITYIGHDSYLFKGTVRDNLLMADARALDGNLWSVLEKVNLADFLRSEQGLETPLAEKAGNLSGGQRQRLALARAILHDTPAYIFDETTSNIDVESEHDIIQLIHELAKVKTVILISHRLANIVSAQTIYVIDQGEVTESGTHQELLECQGVYQRLWQAQQQLENYQKGGENK